MNGFENVLLAAAEQAEKHSKAVDGDYIGYDGLLYCGKCHTPKQFRGNFMGVERVVGSVCQCKAQELDDEKRQFKELQRQEWRRRARMSTITSSMLRDASFDTAQPSETIDKARNYVKNWELVREHNVGMLLMGDVGVGKSYAAACICNALLDRGIPCHMTSFGRILSMEWEERGEFISGLGRYELLVLDDLGAERATEFSNEILFTVIDERYRVKKPLIVTTNLGLPELKNPANMAKKRVYDRLLEICGPVLCQGENFRQSGGKSTRGILAQVLNGKVS